MSASRLARTAAAVAYAGLVVGAFVAPALAFDAANVRGGAARSSGDLALAGSAVGVPYAGYLLHRLSRSREPRSRTDFWLAGVHGLVVLWVAASGLPAAVLHLTSRLHARVADTEWPVLLAWIATAGLAVLLGEGARRSSLRWLGRPRRLSGSAR